MTPPCSTHPDRESTGRCVRCDRFTCRVCTVQAGPRVFCSVLCFTEQALAEKGKSPKVKRSDPLAETLTTDDEPSVVLSAASAQPSEETSILNLSSLKRTSASEESTIVPVEGRMKEPTSILNMAGMAKAADGSWLEEPPKSETPLPILLPGTRRSTIQSTCVFHGDTPAVVRCSLCGDPICTLCIADEEHGGRCSPACRRGRRPARRGPMIAVIAAVAAVAVLAWMFRPTPEPPPAAPPAVARAEADARAAEAERERLEAEAREEARRRVAAREKEEARLKAEADARAKAEAEAKEAALKAEAEAKAAAAAAVAKAEADAREALAKAEVRAAAEAAAKAAREKAEAEARAKAEAEARAKAEAIEKAKAEAAAKALAVETSMKKASGLLREATPAFCSLAGQAEADPDDPRELVPQIDAVAGRLAGARAEYARILKDAETHPTLERRIQILDELLVVLREFRARCVESR